MNAERVKVVVRGAVQGVGFRPFVYRLATSIGLKGWVLNSARGVFIEAEGESARLREFTLRLTKEKPPLAIIQSLESTFLDPAGYSRFEIRESDGVGEKRALILPDIATCGDCLREIFDPHDRRYLYPFTNCTNCGPRFSIIESLPYDRANTSMKKFEMCPECKQEYHDPADRRFHAQPNACSVCGPRLELWDCDGAVLAEGGDALSGVVSAVRSGQILALKGVGGFQLIVDARNEEAIARLRERKRREEKPFALMFPSIDDIRIACRVSDLEERLLTSPESPIVLLDRRIETSAVAPGNPYLGAMLPYSPLHHIFLRELGCAVVATSGNLSDEPICTDEQAALARLRGIADLFLVHNRPIVRHVDDSVARILLGREQILRRARGYAPLPIHVTGALPPILAVGAHLKNTVALAVETDVFISQHIGDLETPEAFSAFRRVSTDLQTLYEVQPEAVACDSHPEYLSTKRAKTMGLPVETVQHHYAHVLACMAENELDGATMGVSWDGTGLGLDGTIWGGEFLVVNESPQPAFVRFAHLRTFRLPGSEAAIKQPRRSALGLLWEIFGRDLFEHSELLPLQQFSQSESNMLRQMLANGVNAPVTSSAGRLFDAVASILGLRHRARFEGQGAMELEFSVERGVTKTYPFRFAESEGVIDWQSMICQILEEQQRGESVGRIAAAFHNTLAEMVVAVARSAGIAKVVLTGGCFQNKYLTERAVARLRENGFRPYWHQRVPPNDGGIALGQVIGAARAIVSRREVREECCA
ncbi:MAG TPA: carbamoyltransferase HypF [Verrucomicrobiae bacterium]|jgi:hydrogenase maturation protein HypF|nr:carbamoyltransferase HypF [Verrucomicrobiae bacterium]